MVGGAIRAHVVGGLKVGVGEGVVVPDLCSAETTAMTAMQHAPFHDSTDWPVCVSRSCFLLQL